MKTYSSIRFSIGLLSFVFLAYTGVVHAQVPDFSYARAAGSSGDERGNSVCTDTDGNSYTIGTFNGEVDFNPSPSATHTLNSFGDDIFVLKLNSNGTFVWAVRIGGNGADEGTAIALDEDNNLLITGSFEQDVDFDPGADETILSSVELRNIFIAKLDDEANLLWAKSIGDTGYEAGNSIANDPANGNIYVTGYFEFTVDFDPNAGTFPLTATGSLDGFVVCLGPDGDFQWADQFGNNEDDQGEGIAISETGRICITGSIGYEESNDDRHSSIYIAAYCLGGGSSPFWEKQIGYAAHNSFHFGKSIITDESGNVFVTGAYYNTMDFDPGSGTFMLNGNSRAAGFILKLGRDGSFAWAHEFSAWDSHGADVEVDGDGNAWILGNTNPEGPWSTLMAVFDTEGESLFYDEFGTDCRGNSLAISATGNIFVTGLFSSTSDFDFSAEVTELTPIGGVDVYIMKLGGAPPPVDDDLDIFNFISANGDGTNGHLHIQNVDASDDTRNNTVTIFNRWGAVVWDTKNYDNINRAFIGNTNNGNELPTGTYYYKIEFAGRKKKTGFLSLRR